MRTNTHIHMDTRRVASFNRIIGKMIMVQG